MRRSMRLIAVLLVVGAVGFGASAAMGTTGNSTAGSLTFSVMLPDNVSAGQTVPWSAALANGSQVSAVNALVTFTLTGPNLHLSSMPWAARFAPGQSFSRSGSFRVPAKAAAGLYTLTMTVNAGQAGSGAASATSTLG